MSEVERRITALSACDQEIMARLCLCGWRFEYLPDGDGLSHSRVWQWKIVSPWGETGLFGSLASAVENAARERLNDRHRT